VLVGEFSETAAVIKYRYTDDGEQVTVPNTWFNRPAHLLVSHAQHKAEAAEARARRLEESPPAGLEPEAVQAIIAHHRQRAERERQSAQLHRRELAG
jgi:hypothetical protein